MAKLSTGAVIHRGNRYHPRYLSEQTGITHDTYQARIGITHETLTRFFLDIKERAKNLSKIEGQKRKPENQKGITHDTY